MTRLEALVATAVHPEDAPGLNEALHRSLATGEGLAMRYRMRRADGAWRWMSSRAEPLRDEGGRILQWYGLCHDVDDQMHAEEALRQNERQLQQLIDTVPVQVWCATPAGEPSYINKTMMDYIGLKLADFDDRGGLQGAIGTIVHPDDREALFGALGRSFATGEPFALKFRNLRHDGAYRWTDGRAEPLRDETGRILQWYGVNVDIEEETQAQSALRTAQDTLARAAQAASLAELSASIAHEVNQPLAAIVANSSACHRWLSAEPPNIERAMLTAERIVRDANSAADVVSRIRALFRQSPEARAPAALDAVVREACELTAEAAARRRARVGIEAEAGLPPVGLDRVQVQQVLVNLIRNGLEAMAEAPGDRMLRIRVRRADDAIRTEVSDTGGGLEFPERVFQPFFTTKPQGMGMGLAISRSIVEAHGGRLWAEGQVPRGATFVFTLPIEAKAEA